MSIAADNAKRIRIDIQHHDPANLDRAQLEDIFKRYANAARIGGTTVEAAAHSEVQRTAKAAASRAGASA